MPDERPLQLSRADLKALSPHQIVSAQESGHLTDLLDGKTDEDIESSQTDLPNGA